MSTPGDFQRTSSLDYRSPIDYERLHDHQHGRVNTQHQPSGKAGTGQAPRNQLGNETWGSSPRARLHGAHVGHHRTLRTRLSAQIPTISAANPQLTAPQPDKGRPSDKSQVLHPACGHQDGGTPVTEWA